MELRGRGGREDVKRKLVVFWNSGSGWRTNGSR